nr:MAG TPA: hypothetical protein [Caudoviricetes sp.]
MSILKLHLLKKIKLFYIEYEKIVNLKIFRRYSSLLYYEVQRF